MANYLHHLDYPKPAKALIIIPRTKMLRRTNQFVYKKTMKKAFT